MKIMGCATVFYLTLLHIGFLECGSHTFSCPNSFTCVSLDECGLETNKVLFRCGKYDDNKYDDNNTMVCCPHEIEKKHIESEKLQKENDRNQCPEKSNLEHVDDRIQSEHSNINLIPEICGVVTVNRIINGDIAIRGQFPWMALLGYKATDHRRNLFTCGGTLINNRYVLTAAHCMEPPARLNVVRLGELDLQSDVDCSINPFSNEKICSPPHEDIEIEKIITHSDFDTKQTRNRFKNDIALIRLKRKVNFSDYIKPICLPFQSTITGEEEIKLIVSGWGKTDNFQLLGSQVLQFAKITSTPVSECTEAQPKDVQPIDHTQLCAGGDFGKDACKGDSGGPLSQIIDPGDASEPYTVQVGIVSFGYKTCGSQTVPTVYTRVAAYLDWILDNMEP